MEIRKGDSLKCEMTIETGEPKCSEQSQCPPFEAFFSLFSHFRYRLQESKRWMLNEN